MALSSVFLYPREREYGADQLWLTREDDGSLSLCFETWVEVANEAIEAGDPSLIADGPHEESVKGLRDGDALYRAMVYLIGEGYVDDDDLEWVVERLAEVAPEMVAAFRAAHAVETARLEAAARAAAEAREAALAPYRATIAAYVERFSDEKLYYPGAGRVYPPKRHWATRFIEEFILEHGALPGAVHRLEIRGHYSGGDHDFSELPQLHAALTGGVAP